MSGFPPAVGGGAAERTTASIEEEDEEAAAPGSPLSSSAAADSVTSAAYDHFVAQNNERLGVKPDGFQTLSIVISKSVGSVPLGLVLRHSAPLNNPGAEGGGGGDAPAERIVFVREAKDGLGRQNGVRAGDVLVAVNGQKVGDHEEAKDLIRMAGLEVRLELIRYEPPPAIRAALEGGTTAPSPAPPPRSPPHSEEGRKLQERLMREGHQANRAGDDAREEGRPEEEVTELYVLSRAKFLECHEAGGRPEPRVSAANMSLKLGDIDGALREYGDMLTQVDRLPPAVAKMVQRKHAETLQLKQQASAQAMVRRLDLDGALPGAEPDDLGAPPTLPPPAPPPPPQLKQQASPPHYSTGSAPKRRRRRRAPKTPRRRPPPSPRRRRSHPTS